MLRITVRAEKRRSANLRQRTLSRNAQQAGAPLAQRAIHHRIAQPRQRPRHA